MLSVKNLSSKHFGFIVISSVLWITLPLCFQKFIQSLETGRFTNQQLGFGVGLALMVCLTFFCDLQKFIFFLKEKPSQKKINLPGQLAFDRLWSIDLPSHLGAILISTTAFAILLIKNLNVALFVAVWTAFSYVLHRRSQRQTEKLSQQFSEKQRTDANSLLIQSQLLNIQVFSAGLSQTIRIGGQVAVYILLYLQFSDRASLGQMIADLEYVGLILAHLQMYLTTRPKIIELETYLKMSAAVATDIAA